MALSELVAVGTTLGAGTTVVGAVAGPTPIRTVVDGPVLFEADLGYEIDNMEGLSVHRGVSGEIVLTLISDDNFSVLQRTLLLQFTLVEP